MSALIARAETRGPQAGFGERIAENQRRVFQIAYSIWAMPPTLRMSRKKHSCALPEVCVAARSGEIPRWVNRIVFRLALNRQRGHRRRLTRDTAWQITETRAMVDGAESAQQQIMLDKLRKEIERLPEKLRSVLQLSLVEETDASEVGAMLGIPAGTVRSRLHTARKLLLEAMK